MGRVVTGEVLSGYRLLYVCHMYAISVLHNNPNCIGLFDKSIYSLVNGGVKVPPDLCFRCHFVTALGVNKNALVTFPEYDTATR